jgi:hypothetical protein
MRRVLAVMCVCVLAAPACTDDSGSLRSAQTFCGHWDDLVARLRGDAPVDAQELDRVRTLVASVEAHAPADIRESTEALAGELRLYYDSWEDAGLELRTWLVERGRDEGAALELVTVIGAGASDEEHAAVFEFVEAEC